MVAAMEKLISLSTAVGKALVLFAFLVSLLAIRPAPLIAADLPVESQLDIVVWEQETKLDDALIKAGNAAQLVTSLQGQIVGCQALSTVAINNLRYLGGPGAGAIADRLGSITNLDTRIDIAHTAAENAGKDGFLSTEAMKPYLEQLEAADRRLQSKQLQLATAQQNLIAANQAIEPARQGLKTATEARDAAEAVGDAIGEAVKAVGNAAEPQYFYIPGTKLPTLIGPDRFRINSTAPSESAGGIRYVTPRFGGLIRGMDYPPKTDATPKGSQSYGGLEIQGKYQRDYMLGDWTPRLFVPYARLPDDSGTARSSQATTAILTESSAQLGTLAFPSDRFFNRTSSWGQDFDDQWALKRIGFETVPTTELHEGLWPIAGRRVLVAVLDTGIDRNHPDLIGRFAVFPRETFGNKTDDDGNGFADDTLGWNFVSNNFDTWDDNGHGTFVAGIIAARTDNGLGIAGVNPFARILAVKVTDHQHASGSKLIAKGIRYAVDRGARIINISIGGPALTTEEQEAVRYAVSKDVLVVVAAGNIGVDTANYGPAGTGGVITVAATDQNDERAKFSNFGRAVDISAPGIDVLSLRAINTDMIAKADKDYKPGSAFVGGAQDYYKASGTSFAAPFVSGVASLLMSKFPNLTGKQVKRMILQSALDIDVPGVDQNTGYGLLDARAALEADPAFFIEAGISGVSVVASGGGRAVRIAGTADADKFVGAHVEMSADTAPDEWKQVGGDISSSVRAGKLVDIPVGEFRGAKQWTIRVIVRHKNDKRREGRFVLKLG
jgi:subtilisin family serine protease